MFYVKLTDDKTNNFKFGIYHGIVHTPDYSHCAPGDKPFSRFFYIIKGTMLFNDSEPGELRAEPGTMLYLPNNVTYRSQWLPGDDGEYISVNFLLDDLYVTLPDEICIAARDKDGYYRKLMTNMLSVWNRGGVGYKLETLSNIYNMLYCLSNDSMRSRTKSEHRTIYKGIIYLENNYVEDISVKQLSDMCNTSESNFRRLFKKYKNMSPITYRNYLRIKKSCDLLHSGEYSIAEAAAEVGINDLCYYYKLYAKFMSGTPRQQVILTTD